MSARGKENEPKKGQDDNERALALTRRELRRSQRRLRGLEEIKRRQESTLGMIIEELEGSQRDLDASRRDLAARVERRTAELAESVAALKRENAERRAVEAQLQRANVELGAARDAALDSSQAKSRFLANMSHEIRTPLNAVIGYTELVLEEPPDTPLREVRADLENVSVAAHHLLRLINEVLSFARIEAGRARAHPQDFDLGELAREIKLMIRALVEEGRNAFVVTAPEPGAAPVRTDRTKLLQIVLNLVGNAAKFTRDGRVEVAARLAAEMIEIEVSDTGIGIEPDVLATIFEPFVQAQRVSTEGGTGLGLTICREFAHLVGGTLSAESELGRGSVFTLRVPRVLEDAQ